MSLRPFPILLFLLMLLCPASLMLADGNSDFEARRIQERKNYDAMIANVPLLEAGRLADALRITSEDNKLVIRTLLGTSLGDAYVHVKFADRDVTGLVRVQGGAQAGANVPVVPTLFQFNLTDYTQPLRIVTTSVNAQVCYCSISKSTQFPNGGYCNVALIQRSNRPGTAPTSVRLSVNDSGHNGSPRACLEINAPDFFTLMHAHSKECDEYVRPLLREVGQEAIFSPDPLVAWQVFSEMWKPQPAVVRQVDAMLPALDVDDFHARARALHALEALGREGAAVLVHLDRARLTPEQNARIDLALAPFAQLSPKEAVRLRSDPTFLLDCLYSDDVTLKNLALVRLRTVADPTIAFDVDAAPAPRQAAIAALRQRLIPRE